MKKRTKSNRKRQQRSQRKKERSGSQRIPSFHDVIREALFSQVQDCVIQVAHQLVQDEVVKLVGEPWSRKGDSSLRRGGNTTSRIYLDGEPALLNRQRVRDAAAGCEVPLKTVQALQDRDALNEDVKRLMVRGVTTRDYDQALGAMSDGLGLQKSAVSSAFIKAAQKDLDGINGRSLSEHKFAVVYIDGTGFHQHTCMIAMGITESGEKLILGARDGSSECTELVADMLANFVERGLQLTPHVLFVIDGGKALKKSVKQVFGSRAQIQRCIAHKERNVLSYLPPEHVAEARRRLRAAWNMNSYGEAKKALEATKRWLAGLNHRAASSLEEGFEETLTVHRLNVGPALRRTLSTTNPIESIMDRIKNHTRRVKRWRDGEMVMRWVGSGLVRVEESFRRVKGHAEMPALIEALERLALQNAKDAA